MLWRLPTRLPFRIPFGLRIFFRGAFALLALATLALALAVLQDEKQRSLRNYADGLRSNQAQIAARLRHPSGQLALLNADVLQRAAARLPVLLLPFGALDFDDRVKAQQAVETAGCAWQYPDGATLCLGLGANPYAGGFVYAVGSFASTELVPHPFGDRDLAGAHRIAVTLDYRGQRSGWLALYELGTDGRGRLSGLEADTASLPGTKPLRDFRGWLWQETRCLDAGSAANCPHRTFLSMRLPVEAFREALASRQPTWPPADIGQMRLRIQALAPGEGAPLFDSDTPGATLPFSLSELAEALLPGEVLHVRRSGAQADLLQLTGSRRSDEPISPWLVQLIDRLPADPVPLQVRETLTTPQGRQELLLAGDVRSVNQGLAAVATRLSGFVGAMLLAVLLTWLAIEVRIIRRVTLLTQRAAAVSTGMRAGDGLASLDLSDLRGRDELGVLAQGLKDLLQRVNDDVRREQIRAAQEKDMWHAVGHEIMSPLQSLMVLHAEAGDPSARYISRMQQAVRVLYGQASPSEAFESTTLALAPLDLDRFLGHVADNAGYIGIEGVEYRSPGQPAMVRADEHSLEDVLGHVLRNAARHRSPGTTIRMTLQPSGSELHVEVHNQGEAIADELLPRIFEYGVSGSEHAAGRGQGLFVARTYMAKMGGTITAANVGDGVVFRLTLPAVQPGG